MQRVCSLLLLAVALFTASCGVSGNGTASAALPNSVQIIRFSHIHNYPPLTQTIQNPAEVRALYGALQELPRLAVPTSCPADYDLEYRLTFSRGSAPMPQIVVNASGCEVVLLAHNDQRKATSAFWVLFAQTLGTSQDSLFPTPIPS